MVLEIECIYQLTRRTHLEAAGSTWHLSMSLVVVILDMGIDDARLGKLWGEKALIFQVGKWRRLGMLMKTKKLPAPLNRTIK